jgi:DMSO/TMAO reductase YedYZ molybdopterin-dependent catalytic subunit
VTTPTDTPRPVRWVRLVGALSGLLSLGVFLAVAELLSTIFGSISAPAIAIGESAIDRTPHQLKDFAIRQFGENDKTVLLTGIFVTLALLAAIAGLLASYEIRIGLAAITLLTVVAALAALSRPTGGIGDMVPAIVGGMAALATLYALRIKQSRLEDGSSLTRRQLLRIGVSVAAAAAFAGETGRLILAHTGTAVASRKGVKIPAPTSKAPAITGNPQADAPGAKPFYTPNTAFYRVDTALSVPQVDANGWSLKIHGMVDQPFTITYAELLAMPLVERDVTLTCISNDIGGPYVGNARWTGVLLAPLLKKAGVQAASTQILSRSVDGWTCGTPTAVVMDGRDAMLAVAMNGEPLPLQHGFPVRMVVPGLYGYASATKWVTDIELTTFERKAYWITRGYAQLGPIKTQSRIDTPKPLAQVAAGMVPVAGVAWAQHKGIAKVEISIDGGAWTAATLAGEDTIDTWRQWVYPWQATAGPHRIAVRATDKTGYVQTATRKATYPDGATGRQELLVTVT